MPQKVMKIKIFVQVCHAISNSIVQISYCVSEPAHFLFIMGTISTNKAVNSQKRKFLF